MAHVRVQDTCDKRENATCGANRFVDLNSTGGTRRLNWLHTRVVRDVVEVVAIALAGGWALYVFVYQNMIVPSLAAPSPSFTVQMRHVGNDGPLAVIRLDETIRNIGTVRIHFLGHSITVLGMRVIQLQTPREPTRASTQAQLYAYSRFSKPQVVYRDILVTSLGQPSHAQDLVVEPGVQVSISTEFYVPLGLFNRLEAFLTAPYTKNDSHPIATTVTIGHSGLPHFHWKGGDAMQIAAPVAELDLQAE